MDCQKTQKWQAQPGTALAIAIEVAINLRDQGSPLIEYLVDMCLQLYSNASYGVACSVNVLLSSACCAVVVSSHVIFCASLAVSMS